MTTFAELGTPAPMVAALRRGGIVEPFPIQAATVPAGLAGRDLCGKAPTGSGKTIAFSIVLAARCPSAQRGRPTGLVLVPTRELAEQVATELRMIAAPMGVSVRAVYGGVPINRDLRAFDRPVDVVVACPGRLRDLIDRGSIHLGHVAVAVVDEADRLADMGFLPETRRLLGETPKDRQTLLFSATLDGDVDVLVRNHQKGPMRVEVESEDDEAGSVLHHAWAVKRDKRLDTAAEVLSRWRSAVVFTRTRHGADRVAEQLHRRGITCAALHGDKSQGQRDRALARFRDGEVRALVATDVAARGIHVDSVAGVLQYDVPADHKDYTHRAGRTGRAGETGDVVTFVIPEARDAWGKVVVDLDAEIAEQLRTVEFTAALLDELGPVVEVTPTPARPAGRGQKPTPSPSPSRGPKRGASNSGPSSGKRRSGNARAGAPVPDKTAAGPAGSAKAAAGKGPTRKAKPRKGSPKPGGAGSPAVRSDRAGGARSGPPRGRAGSASPRGRRRSR